MKSFLSFVSFFLAFSLGAGHADDKSDVQAVIDAIHAASNENNKIKLSNTIQARQQSSIGGETLCGRGIGKNPEIG